MLLSYVQLLALAEHRLICLNLGEAAGTLPCDLDIAAMDGASPPRRKRIQRGFDPAAVGDAIGVDAGDHLRFRQPDARVPCWTGADLPFSDHANVAIAAGKERKSTRLKSSHSCASRMPSCACKKKQAKSTS